MDGSNQDEKFQSKTIDRFEVDPQLLAENQVEITAVIYPPLESKFGAFLAFNCENGVTSEHCAPLEFKPCRAD